MLDGALLVGCLVVYSGNYNLLRLNKYGFRKPFVYKCMASLFTLDWNRDALEEVAMAI